MVPTFQLDLNSVTIDVSLAQRVPYALSRYYLALPLGQDNGSVSVAMAYPQNVKAREVLSRILQAKVVPVFTSAELLLPALERVYHPEDRECHTILAWYEQPEAATAVTRTAHLLSNLLQAPAATYSSADLSLEEVLNLATTGEYELVVMSWPGYEILSTVLNKTATPLFFVRGQQPSMRHILVIMRSFASDEWALDWLVPFVRRQQAAITLMPLVNSNGLYLHPYPSQDSPAGQHLERCLQRLQNKGISVNLKYRFGNAVQRIVDEVTGDAYDLLVLAAEAEGDFVSRVITAVDQHNARHNLSIFVLKPPELQGRSITVFS